MIPFSRDRVLVIGDEMRIFLTVTRALGRAGREVHVVPFTSDSPALSSRYVARRHSVPLYQDDPGGWLAALRKILRDNHISLVIPTCDRAILPLHEHRDELAEFRLAIPSPDAMSALFDKQHTRQLCARLGVPVAKGARLSSGDDAHELAQRYGLPLIIKPRRSYWLDRMETWGRVHVVDDENALGQVLSQISDHPRYLVEGCFEGCGVGLSVLASGGKILQAFQHRRLREGRGGSSSYRVSEALNEELLDACARISRELGLTGVCMFEFRYNLDTGKWILIETNARFWGSMSLPLSLGIDFPNLLYDLLVSGKEHEPRPYPAGVRSRNFVLDGRNLLSLIQGKASLAEKLRETRDFLAQPLYWATGRERSDSFVLDDLVPALRESLNLVSNPSVSKAVRRFTQPASRKASTEAPAGSPVAIRDGSDLTK